MKCDFYAIDFETANESLDSACSIGIVGFINGQIAVEEHFYFNPHQNFLENNIRIHHITPEMVWNKPDFSKIYDQIYPYFDNTIIVCHNALFDMNVLKALVERYHLKVPNVQFVCTYRMSKVLWDQYDGFLNHRLDTLGRYLGVEFNHHDALDDARICGLVALRIEKIEQADSLIDASRKLSLMPGVYNQKRYYGTFKVDIPSKVESAKYLDKVFFISGNSPFKKKMIEELKKNGAIIEKTFRDNCDYFVMLADYDIIKASIAKRKKYIKLLNEVQLLGELYDC